MSKGILNWTFRDVETFLKEHSFVLNHTNGSHYYYVGYVDKIMRQVCLPRHGSLSIKPRTMKGIIAQSGISKEKWFGNK